MSGIDTQDGAAAPYGMAAWVAQHLAAQAKLHLPPQAVWAEYLTPEQIRDARQHRQMSQRDLALAMNISTARSSRWETGDAIPLRREFVRLRDIFNLPKEGPPHE